MLKGFLGKRFFALNQMAEIAVCVFKEDQPVALIRERFSLELHALRLKLRVSSIKIVNGDRQMTDSWSVHFVGAGGAIARNDLKHGSVLSLHEIVAGIFEVDMKFEMLDIPISESLGVWGSDCGVL